MSRALRVATGVALVVVDEVLPPAPAPFEEVKQTVSSAVVEARSRKAAIEAARASHQKHGNPAAIAKAVGGEVRSSGDLAPGQAAPETGGGGGEFRKTLFHDDVTTGQSGAIEVPAGAIVYEVSRREPFDATRFDSEKNELREQLLRERRSNYSLSIINQLRSREDVVENPTWRDILDSAG